MPHVVFIYPASHYHRSSPPITTATYYHPSSPRLPPSLITSLAAYYAPYNQRLYQWMKDTKADASPHEPTFKVGLGR